MKKVEISTLRLTTFGVIYIFLSLTGAGTCYYYHRKTILAAKDKKSVHRGKENPFKRFGENFC